MGLLTVALTVSSAQARKAPQSAEPEGPNEAEITAQARSVFTDLAGNSNPFVRRIAFDGLMSLEKADVSLALDKGLAESDWTIRRMALTTVLNGRDKKRRKLAIAAVDKLLQSGDEAEREQGVELLNAHFKGKARLARINDAAKLGSPDARSAARAMLRAEGGKTAWKVIQAGLGEAEAEAEHKEAVEALKTFKHPVAVKWALKNVQNTTEIGDLARALLVRVDDKRASKSIDKTLKKAYAKAKGEFEQRVRLARVLAGRGHAALVQRTLLAGLRFRKGEVRVLAWQGLQTVRDITILGKVRERILGNEKPLEADAAFAWMQAWGKANAEPKVFEVLQEGARGDRRPIRLRAMKVLTALGHRESVVLFEGAMREGEAEVRLVAAQGIAAVAKPGDEKRVAKLLRREPDAEVKTALIRALAAIGTPEIINTLQFVVTAPQKALKLAALDAVAATDDPKVASLLGLLKRDPDVEVRFAAWHALLRLKGSKMEREFLAATTWLTPSHVEALGKDTKISLDVLEHLARAGTDEQRGFAVDALVGRGVGAATRLLSLSEGANEDTAAAALTGLAKLRGVDSVPTYRKSIKSKFGVVRAAGFAAIGDHGPVALLEVIMSGMGDKSPQARVAAALASLKLIRRDDTKKPGKKRRRRKK
jgi:hypothetical protein